MKKLLKDLMNEVNAVKDHYETATHFRDGAASQLHYTQKARRAVDNCRSLITQLEKETGE